MLALPGGGRQQCSSTTFWNCREPIAGCWRKGPTANGESTEQCRKDPPRAFVISHLRKMQGGSYGAPGAFYRPLSSSEEDNVKRLEIGILVLAMMLTSAVRSRAQEQGAPQPEQKLQKADGERRGLPLETYAVAPGTKFLVRLENELGTKGGQENAKFKVKTLEPLEAGSGIYLPPGAEIRGHISRVEPAGVGGRGETSFAFCE